MNTRRPRRFLGSAFFVAVLLFALPYRAYAFYVMQYHYVGIVSPSASRLCDIASSVKYSSAFTYEGGVASIFSTSGGGLCVTLPAGTKLTGNFYVLYAGLTSGDTFYGTVATPNAVAEPKYAIAGVFYAPPCSSSKSANSVAYGSANQLKVDNSLTDEYTESESVTVSGSGGVGIVSISGSLSNGWSASSISGTDVAVTTSNSESYTIDGCVAVDGINHSYDIIWIWLDPVVPYYIPSPSTASLQDILVLGIGSDDRDPVTSQAKAPDVIALSVIQIQRLITVLSSSETPTPTNTGIDASTLQELQRTWDTTWATNSGGEPGPGLVAADYEDILKADPFVANASFDPASSTRYALVSGATVIYDATSTPTEYSYTGQATDAVSQTSGTDDQHYVSVEVSVGVGLGKVASAKLDYTNKWLWDTKSQSTTTNSSTQTATFNIWTPAASYSGPDQLAVYWDTVYQTFVFYPL